MKKLSNPALTVNCVLTLIILFLFSDQTVFSQCFWNQDGSNIYYNSGNVGIGTTTPKTNLHVNTPNKDNIALTIQGYTSNTDAVPHYVAVALDGDYGNGTGNSSQIRSYSNLYVNWGSSLTFHTTNSTSNALIERMRIDYFGSVGIGTSSPGRLLTIRKDVPNGIGAGIMLMNNQYNDNNGAETEIIFSNYTSNNEPFRYFRIHNVGEDEFGTPGRLSFGSTTEGNVYRDLMTIKSNGNMGIGTLNPTEKLDINGNLIIGNLGGGNPGKLSYRRNTDGAVAASSGFVTDQEFAFKSWGGGSFFTFSTGFGEKMRIIENGNVGIGTTTPNYKLDVNGTIHTKEVKVDLNGWSDYVFEKDYKLRTLNEVESFINENGHLPEIPSAKEVEENGLNVGEMNALMMKKIEEQTLYIIELNKTIIKLNERIETLENKTTK